MNCVICNEVITADPYGWEGGCNAEPIRKGKCCHDCDQTVVIPYRIKLMLNEKTKEGTDNVGNSKTKSG